jgi:hypothetical protein
MPPGKSNSGVERLSHRAVRRGAHISSSGLLCRIARRTRRRSPASRKRRRSSSVSRMSGGTAGVLALTRQNIFGENFHADFHGRMENAVDARLQNDKLADADRRAEIEIVHRGRNDVAIRMAMSGESACDVDQVHHAAAEHIAERIRVVGQNGLDHFRTRGADGLAGQGRGRIFF